MPKKQRATPVALRTKPKGGAVNKKTAVKRAGKDKNILVDSKALVTEMKDAEKKLDKEKDMKKANEIVTEMEDIEKKLDESIDNFLTLIKKATQMLRELGDVPEDIESCRSAKARLVYCNCVRIDDSLAQCEKIYKTSKRNSCNMGRMLQMSEFISTLV